MQFIYCCLLQFLLSRVVNAYQFGGVFLITVGIVLIKVPDLLQYNGLYDETVTIAYVKINNTFVAPEGRDESLPVSALFLALLSSSLAGESINYGLLKEIYLNDFFVASLCLHLHGADFQRFSIAVLGSLHSD